MSWGLIGIMRIWRWSLAFGLCAGDHLEGCLGAGFGADFEVDWGFVWVTCGESSRLIGVGVGKVTGVVLVFVNAVV